MGTFLIVATFIILLISFFKFFSYISNFINELKENREALKDIEFNSIKDIFKTRKEINNLINTIETNKKEVVKNTFLK